MRALATVSVALIALLIIVGLNLDTQQDIPACELEDGSTQQVCFWDGSKHGNGQGKSYILRDYGQITEVQEED
jgi:hypothetical protein